jgi:hypothetical protein
MLNQSINQVSSVGLVDAIGAIFISDLLDEALEGGHQPLGWTVPYAQALMKCVQGGRKNIAGTVELFLA